MSIDYKYTLLLLFLCQAPTPTPDEIRYAFYGEWYDVQASVMRNYIVLHYGADASTEIFDIKTNKKVLRRTTVENVSSDDMYIGSVVTVFAKKIRLTDYADVYTRNLMCLRNQRTFAMIKPDGIENMGDIIKDIYRGGLRIVQAKLVTVPRSLAEEFYKEHANRDFFGNLIRYITEGPVLAMILVGENAVQKWRATLGPTDSAEARRSAPVSIRAKYGKDKTYNAAHGSDSIESACREMSLFFSVDETNNPIKPKTTAAFRNCTCCVIKPHAVKQGAVGDIIRDIQKRNFTVSALEMFYMENVDAAEFYEVYHNVVSEYPQMVTQLISGPSIALEVTSNCDTTQTMFREFVGPADPDAARLLRPDTLRAKYGIDKIRNAVHCTDLPEDGLMEVEYFFKFLQ